MNHREYKTQLPMAKTKPRAMLPGLYAGGEWLMLVEVLFNKSMWVSHKWISGPL